MSEFEQNKPAIDDFDKNTRRDTAERARSKLEAQIWASENSGEKPIDQQIKELGQDGIVTDELAEKIKGITNPDVLSSLATGTSNPDVQEILKQRLEELAIDKILPVIESIDDSSDPTGAKAERVIREAITKGVMAALDTVAIVQRDLAEKMKKANPIEDQKKIADLKWRVDEVQRKLEEAIVT